MSTTSSNAPFHVSGGQIIGPSGQTFVANGVDIWANQVIGDPTGSANLITSLFPNANMVRIAAGDGYAADSAAALTPFINLMTSKGVVVEIGNYNPALTSSVATGQGLTDELAWFTSLATAFKGNPNVWFSTDNEPGDQYTYAGATSAEQLAVYNAIRATGSTSMIGLENTQWVGGSSASINAGNIAGMTNVHWDDHYYNWLSGYSTSLAANQSALQGEIAGSQAFHSADGTIPVIIGEFGDSTMGYGGVDAGAVATVQAVTQSAYGWTAWGINSGGADDELTSGNSLSAYGQQVVAAMNSPPVPPASSPPVAPASPPPLLPASPDGTKITTAAASPIIDQAGNAWTLVQSAAKGLQIAVNGAVDPTSANVVLLEILGGKIVQENTAGNWYSKPGPSGAWSQITAPPAPPAPSPDGTKITTSAASPIIDQAGNAWTLVQSAAKGQQIAVNGIVDPTTANVVLFESLGGKIVQENTAGNWYSKPGPSGAWSQIPAPAAPAAPAVPPAPSPDGTQITAAAANPIIDQAGNVWTLVQSAAKGLQIAVNGTIDPTTANVTLLETLGGKIVQENTAGNWYSKPGPSGAWSQIAAPVTTGSGSQSSVSDTSDHGSLTKNLSQTGIYTVGGDVFLLHSGNTAFVILAGGGASQIAFIGASSVLVAGGVGQTIVTADTGNNQFIAGAGTLDVTGGTGKDAYVFHANSGLLKIEDFSIAKGDTLTIDKALQGAMQQTTDGQGGTLLTFGAGATHGVDIHGMAILPTASITWG